MKKLLNFDISLISQGSSEDYAENEKILIIIN